MKNILLFSFILLNITVNSQGLGGLLKKATSLVSESGSGLSSQDIANGLKEALTIGAEKGCVNLSKSDGFFKNAVIKLDEYSSKVERAEKEMAENVVNFQKLVTYYGYGANDAKYKNPEEFFILMNDFVIEVDKSVPKTEPKKVFKGK